MVLSFLVTLDGLFTGTWERVFICLLAVTQLKMFSLPFLSYDADQEAYVMATPFFGKHTKHILKAPLSSDNRIPLAGKD